MDDDDEEDHARPRNDSGVGHYVRRTFRAAGRRFAEARRAYHEGRDGVSTGDAAAFDLPVDDAGRGRVVCRRYRERRAVAVDEEGRPDCFDADHPDCRGCAEDVREGVVETW